MTRAGRLRHRVTIEQNTPVQDTVGQPIEAWTTYKTRWARVVPLAGGERYDASQETAHRTHRFEMRYTAGITPLMRVVHDGRTFDVEVVQTVPEERPVETHVWTREIVP